MISYLKGEVLGADDKSLTILINNIGYEVLCPLPALAISKINEEREFFVYTHVREDQITLFGFENLEEKEVFKKLMSVSGIGPRSALAMLSVATTSNIIRGIESGDVNNFPKVPGVGKKTLEKMIVELKGKFDNVLISDETEDMRNAKLALESLGYNMRDISTALSKLHPDLDMNSLIKEALKILSRV